MVKYIYDAWGNHAVIDANGQDIVNMQHIGNLNPFRYRSYYYDTETGLYYLQTRYYDPELGRFISQDSIEYADYESVNGLNLYAYCGNNPVNNIDPMGTWSWKKFWKRFGIIVGAVVAVAAVTAAVVLTAGAAAVALGASAAVTAGIMAGAAVGGIAAGTYSIVSQSVNSGIDNLNIGTVALTTFGGSTIGAVVGGAMALSGGAAGSFAIAGGGSVNVGSAIAKVGALGLSILFAKWKPGSWPGDDPKVSPGDGFVWRGQGEIGSKFGEWYNPETGDQLHPDLNHPLPKGPHWDWRNKILRILKVIFK